MFVVELKEAGYRPDNLRLPALKGVEGMRRRPQSGGPARSQGRFAH